MGNDTNFGGIQVVEMDPQEMASALSRGDIKGYVADQYIGTENVLTGKAKWLRRSQDVWKNETCCVLTLNKDFIAEYQQSHSGTDRRLCRIWIIYLQEPQDDRPYRRRPDTD